MPRGTPVDRMYRAIKRRLQRERGKADGKIEESAARIAQWKTGLALATGKPPKRKKRRRRPATQ